MDLLPRTPTLQPPILIPNPPSISDSGLYYDADDQYPNAYEDSDAPPDGATGEEKEEVSKEARLYSKKFPDSYGRKYIAVESLWLVFITDLRPYTIKV